MDKEDSAKSNGSDELSRPPSSAAEGAPAPQSEPVPEKPQTKVAPSELVVEPATVKSEPAQPAQDVAPSQPESHTAISIPAPVESLTQEASELVRAVYEHPWAIRFCHWLNAVSLFVLVASGLRIFDAFPSFGPRVPEKDLLEIPKALTLGGWLGGALTWHFTFMWIFAGTGIFYLAYQFLSGHYRTVVFTRKDVSGVWPMVRHYFLFGPKPEITEQYNPLQKLAYNATVLFGAASGLTGVVLYKPVQFSWLARLMGGFHLARIWHFAAMCGFLSFIPGHLIMVILHGWNNFVSMLTGWKKDPEYRAQ